MANPSKNFEMIRLYPRLGADPISGKIGEIYYNTSFNTLRICINSTPTWANVGETSAGFQDNNSLLINGGTWTHSVISGNNYISFSEDAFLQLPSIPNASNKIEINSFQLNDNQALYVDVNRTATPSTLIPLISDIDSIASGGDRFIIARRIGDTIIVDNRLALVENSDGLLNENQTTVDTQNLNIKMIGGGTWSFINGTISSSDSAYIQLNGIPLTSNEISPISINLDSGNILYCVINRTETASTLTVQEVQANEKLPLNSYIIAYNDGVKAWISDAFCLSDGEYKEAGENVSSGLISSLGLASAIDKEGQLRLLAEATASSEIFITPLNKTAIDQTLRSLSVKNVNAIFEGAKINWQTGEIYDYSGITLISSFTLPTTEVPDGESRWYSISLSPSPVNIDNEVQLNIITIPSSSSTSKASYASSSIHVGQVLVENIGGIIQPIQQGNIIQNTLGAGAGGANVNLSNLETTAINQDLLPDLTNSKDLGSELLAFANTYSYAIRTNGITTITGLGSITVGNALTMASNGISNLADPTLAQDAATKAYVDTTANAKVEDQIVDGVTTKAPSQNAVYDALGLKVAKAGDTMTGTLSVNSGTGYFSELSIYGLNAQQSGYTSSTYNDQGIILNNIAPVALNNNITAAQIQMTSPNAEFTIDSQADRKLEFIDKVQNRRMLFNQGQLELSIVDLSIPFMPTITGAIIPTQDYHAATKKYVDDTANAVANAKVEDQIVDNVTTKAPSQNAVYDALMLKLNLSGGTMSGALSMGTTNKITDLATPTASADAANKSYVDTTANAKVADAINDGTTTIAPSQNAVYDALALKLNLSGGTMSGSINMNSNNITSINQLQGIGGSPYTIKDRTSTNIGGSFSFTLSNTGSNQIGQSFTTTSSYSLTKVLVKLFSFASLTGSMTMSLYTTSGNLPVSLLATSSSVNLASLGNSVWTDVSFTFPTPYTLTSGQVYAITITPTGTPNGTTLLARPIDNTVPYAGGTYITNTGSGWSVSVGNDLYVELYSGSGGSSSIIDLSTSGQINVNSNKITSLATPTASADAATKQYVDDTANAKVADAINDAVTTIAPSQNAVFDALALKLNLSGGTMSGALNMGITNKITNLATPTASADAATKQYVDDGLALKLNLSGGTMTGNIVMGTNSVAGSVADPFVVQQSYTGASLYTFETLTTTRIAQTFTTVGGYTLTKFALKLYKTQSNTTGTIRGRVYTVSGSVPSVLLATSQDIDVSTLGFGSGNAAEVEFVLAVPTALSAATVYAVAYEIVSVANGTVGYAYSTSSPYAGGNFATYFSAAWTAYMSQDMYFKTYSGTGSSSGASISFATAGALTLNNALIKGVAAGVDSTDAVNKSQLETAAGVTATVSGANNQSSAANVTGLLFTSSGKALVEVVVNATSSLYEVFDILVVKKGATYAIDYLAHGDASGVDFTITSGGQVQYTSMSYTGFSSMTIKHKFTQI